MDQAEAVQAAGNGSEPGSKPESSAPAGPEPDSSAGAGAEPGSSAEAPDKGGGQDERNSAMKDEPNERSNNNDNTTDDSDIIEKNSSGIMKPEKQAACNNGNVPPSPAANANGEVPKEDVKEKVILKKRFTIWSSSSYIINCIIGAGIFVSPQSIMKETGSSGLYLIIWALCGLLTFAEALVYAELAMSNPVSGGDYSYIKMTFGNLIAFVAGCIRIFVLVPCSQAIKSLSLANYIILPIFGSCDPPQQAVVLVAIILYCSLCAINCFRIKWGSWVSVVTSAGKISALVIISIVGIYYIARGLSS